MFESIELDADELLVLARADLEHGRSDRALIKFKAGLARQDAPPAFVVEAAKLYAQLGLRAKALVLFERYLRQQPDDLDAQFQIGMLRFESGEIGDALKMWSRVLSRDPLYPPALFYGAIAYAESERIEEAASLLKTLLGNVAADNLYFGRARDLLPKFEGKSAGSGRPDVSDAYKIEH